MTQTVHPKILADTRQLSREEWLQLRRHGIGGSDAAAILGLHRWRSAVDVWLEKMGQTPEREDNEAMFWGRALEDIIARELARRTGWRIRRRCAILRHPTHEWMIANVDRFVRAPDGPALLEIKTTGAHREADWDEGPPLETQVQVQHYLEVTGLDRAVVAVLIGGQKFRTFDLSRDQEVISILVEAERAFWHNYVLAGQPPPADGGSACADILRRLYPRAVHSRIELPPEAAELVAKYREASDRERWAVREREEAKNQLCQLLGDAAIGVLPGWEVRWENRTRTVIDSDRLQRDEPEVYDRFCRVVHYRQFGIARTSNE